MNIKATLQLWLFGLVKVPMIFWVRPKVIVLDQHKTEVKIPLRRRTKNHLGSMYFGTLCVGADIAGGIQLVRILGTQINKVSFAFKDFEAEFLKRAEADVHFCSESGPLIEALVEKARQSKQREEVKIPIVAITPSKQNECVAKFTLTLSLKFKQ